METTVDYTYNLISSLTMQTLADGCINNSKSVVNIHSNRELLPHLEAAAYTSSNAPKP